MDIVEKLETSKANIRQISILASIPEGRVYKWVQRKSSPSGSDLKTIEHVVELISNLSKEEIKKTVHQVANENNDLQQALKIATGNSSIKVEDLPVGDNINGNSENKNVKSYSVVKDKTLSSLSSKKKEDDMNVNNLTEAQKDYAIAMKDMAKANLILARILEEKYGVEETHPKEKRG